MALMRNWRLSTWLVEPARSRRFSAAYLTRVGGPRDGDVLALSSGRCPRRFFKQVAACTGPCSWPKLQRAEQLDWPAFPAPGQDWVLFPVLAPGETVQAWISGQLPA